jgi:hypothetical protein
MLDFNFCEILLLFYYFIILLFYLCFRMLKLSKEGMKDEAEVINQMLMPLHERYSVQCIIIIASSSLSLSALHFMRIYFTIQSNS